jgi:sporulation protein YlmC with PRC-barrel domain
MAIELLSRLEKWRICSQNRDVRGLKLVDDSGISLGVVRDLIVNTETGVVERLVLDNRAEYPVNDIAFLEDTLQLRREEFLTGGGAGAAVEPESVLRVRCERV